MDEVFVKNIIMIFLGKYVRAISNIKSSKLRT